jgi:putative DNA primase/helicase
MMNDCPRWHGFLNTVTGGDEKLKKFLQVSCGYALTGLVREQVLLFLYGTGRNGKSVFIRTISDIFGDYHTAAPMEMLIDAIHDRHPTDLAGCGGRD